MLDTLGEGSGLRGARRHKDGSQHHQGGTGRSYRSLHGLRSRCTDPHSVFVVMMGRWQTFDAAFETALGGVALAQPMREHMSY